MVNDPDREIGGLSVKLSNHVSRYKARIMQLSSSAMLNKTDRSDKLEGSCIVLLRQQIAWMQGQTLQLVECGQKCWTKGV
jgi:hypothetical protein